MLLTSYLRVDIVTVIVLLLFIVYNIFSRGLHISWCCNLTILRNFEPNCLIVITCTYYLVSTSFLWAVLTWSLCVNLMLRETMLREGFFIELKNVHHTALQLRSLFTRATHKIEFLRPFLLNLHHFPCSHNNSTS